DVAWLRENHSGKLIAHFLNDAVLMREAVSRAITGIAKDFLTLLFLIGVMFYQDVWLTFIAIFVLPAVAVFVRQLARRMRKSVTHGMEETGNLSTMLAEALEGVRVVRAYGREDHEIDRVSHSINLRLEHIMRGVRARSAASPITEALTGIAIAAAIYYAGARAISGEMELNHFVAFLGAMMLAYQPLKSLATLSTALQEGLAAAARSFAVLDIAPKVKDEDTAEMRQISEGRIRFRDVSFSYGGGVPALRQIDFEIAPGETIALVGPSGAGKSTILNLIPRFYDVTEGAVEIDGHDVKQFTLQSLRAGMAVVTQEQFLFDDTIRANIAYGRQDATDAEIERAARAADAHNFISLLRDGYDTIVGESGLKLSGGQRQRIAIARAMLKDAPILLLDEATSALDTESERLVQAALDKLLRGRTALVIAHRLSTVMNADRIHVMVDGRIVETGTHAQLLMQDGVYARLCRTQFDMGDQATDSAQRSAQPVTLH
ncbi:MAG TPA: ABC transporter permease, partial [Alphaproteobacteria bacterium]|nr:ABC transporter permease [Alphaproteobacteria bacterium]